MSRKRDTPGTRSGRTAETSWSSVSNHLRKSSEHFFNGVLAANRMMIPSLDGERRRTNGEADDRVAELAYTEEEWSFERTEETRDQLAVGDSVRFTKRLSDEDVRSFGLSSGDTNRIHVDQDFAERTRFEDRIIPGALLSGLISAALARLPGVTIYLSQDLEFVSPGTIGERFTATCEVVETLSERRYRLETVVCDQDGNTLVEGEAIVLLDESPET